MHHELYRGFYSLGGLNYTGGIIMFIGVLLVGVIIYLLVRNNKVNNVFSNSNSSESILKERLASGDITVEEYENIIEKIKKH